MRALILTLAFLSFGFSSMVRANVCSRTPEVVKGLEIATHKDCADIGTADLAQVTSLNFIKEPQGNQITLVSLKTGDFADLVGLKYLGIWNSPALTMLPPEIFKDLKSVTILAIEVTGITSVDKSIFSGLEKLQSLSLSINQIHELPAGIFAGLDSLTSLDLEGDQLDTIPQGLFKGLSKMTWLEIAGNNFAKLPRGVFDGLSPGVEIDFYEEDMSNSEHRRIEEEYPHYQFDWHF